MFSKKRPTRGDTYQPSQHAISEFFNKQIQARNDLKAGNNPKPVYVPEVTVQQSNNIARDIAAKDLQRQKLAALNIEAFYTEDSTSPIYLAVRR